MALRLLETKHGGWTWHLLGKHGSIAGYHRSTSREEALKAIEATVEELRAELEKVKAVA